MATKTQDIRNIAILGHNSTGKTSLIDALAFQAKASTRLGKVSEGTSISDFLPDEIEKKYSIATSVVTFEYKEKKLNFLDTPGYLDFVGESISALRAADIALIVVGAGEGVHFLTKKFIKEANKDNLGKVFFVNKLDKENTSFDAVFAEIKESIKTGAVPMELPIGEGSNFKGVVNLITQKAFEYTDDKGTFKEIPIPEDMKEKVEEYRLKMIEGIAEGDDALIEKYFDTGSLSEQEIHDGLINGLVKGKISAILCGSAEKNIGMHSLLEIIDFYMPSPADRKTITVLDSESGEETTLNVDITAPLSALVFKSTTESHVGDVNYLRIFTGDLKTGMELKNITKESTERVGQIFISKGKDRKEINEVVAGDICVLVKLKNTSVGDSLCDTKHHVKFSSIDFPKPIMDLAISVSDKAEEDRLGTGLHKIVEQDPTIRYRVDSELKQTIVSGMGEQQIENVKKQLERKFNVHISIDKPNIPYKETLKKTAKAQGKHKKQSGGHGQYGDCWLEVGPLPMDSENNFEFENKIFGGAIPSRYVPAIEKGIKDAMAKGVLAGQRMIKVKATVYDGSYHNVDSSDMAFQIAGALAFRNATKEANPVLLEPINIMKIYVADEFLGDIMGDLNGRRGKILGMDEEEGLKIVNAFVPAAELYKYANDLKSMTQGTGNFEMQFDHYEEVPHDVSKKIIEAYNTAKAEE